MADVRALLRQQRAARRIEHPQAAYSDAGKLLCTVCHEHIKAESLWEGHLRSVNHRQRLQLKSQGNAKENGHSGEKNTQHDPQNGAGAQSLKRKLDEDEIMGDPDDDQIPQEDTMRKKRSRPDMTLGELSSLKKDEKPTTPASTASNHKPITPPFTRRQSGTPTLGVEMQIPSRPATPGAMPQSAGSSAGGTSAATTPKTAGPFGRSPLIPHDPSSATAITSQLNTKPSSTTPSQPSAPTAATIDEDEWAAFEAEVVHGTTTAGATAVPEDAVISAPAMSAEEIAAKSEEEERAKRRALADIQIEDEREDATRALETEFEVMEELEARARKLRERREALRLRHGSVVGGDGEGLPKASTGGDSSVDSKGAIALGKENAVMGEGDDDEDEEEDEADDWVGFRFRS